MCRYWCLRAHVVPFASWEIQVMPILSIDCIVVLGRNNCRCLLSYLFFGCDKTLLPEPLELMRRLCQNTTVHCKMQVVRAGLLEVAGHMLSAAACLPGKCTSQQATWVYCVALECQCYRMSRTIGCRTTRIVGCRRSRTTGCRMSRTTGCRMSSTTGCRRAS